MDHDRMAMVTGGVLLALIACRGAAFSYEGKIVVSGLDFEVNKGDYICVVGENGSGKSTLMKGLLRLKQPHLGSVVLGDGLLANEIGYLPQQTAAQKDFPASAYEVVLSGRLGARGVRPFYSKADKEAAKNCLSMLGISSLENSCYRELSGGMQQRVLLCRALCATQKMLLLDEPAASLDPVVRREMYGILKEINRDMGIAVVMVSHDVQSAAEHAGHILHLSNRQIFFGTTDEYLRSAEGSRFIGIRDGELHD